MNLNRLNSRRGFTLIELVVVIALLGILAVVVLPRMADLTDDAHRASVDGTAGALVVGVNLTHAQWIAKGKPDDVDDLPDFGNGDVNLSQFGWPVGTTGSDNSFSMTIAKCIEVWDSLLIDQAPRVGTSLTVDYGVSLGGSSSQCVYTYQGGGGTSRTITYDAQNGATLIDNG